MISASELMIGNWVDVKNFGLARISALDKLNNDILPVVYNNKTEIKVVESFLTPIILSPEIMEKCVIFEHTLWNKVIKEYWYEISNHVKISLWFGMKKDDPNSLDRVFIGSLGSGSDYEFNNIQYLHQLQNLIKLFTGLELPINL